MKSATVIGGARQPAWYYPLVSQPAGNNFANSTPGDAFRYDCKPWASRTVAYGGASLTSDQKCQDMALNHTAFVRGCSQFIVEFAGDYLEQATANSDVATGQRSDGILDFDLVAITGGTPQKRIRWYGMERKYADNPIIDPTNKRYYLDVKPVASWIALDLSGGPLPFEKISPPMGLFPAQQGDLTLNSYVCAWSPYDLQFPAVGDDNALLTANVKGGLLGALVPMSTAYPKGFMPWMVRITMRVDDPNGRLQEGQTIQYVFNLPHP